MAVLLASLFSLVAVTQFTTADKTAGHNAGLKALIAEAPLSLQEATEEWLLQEEIQESDDQEAPSDLSSFRASVASVAMVNFQIPSFTELPTPVPDILVLLVMCAGFGLTCRVRRIIRTFASFASQEEAKPEVEVEGTDAFGCTKLHVAAHAGSLEDARCLLQKGANPNAQEAWDETPLHMAARAGHLQIAMLLVTHGAGVNVRNADDETPLVVGARAGKHDLCSYLLEMGAGTGGLEEEKLPCLLSNLLLR